MQELSRGAQYLFVLINAAVLFLIPFYFFDNGVNVYAWMIVATLLVGVFASIKLSLLNHLYYFSVFLFVYVAVYFIQASIGIRFLLGGESVGQTSFEVMVFFMVHVCVLLFAGVLTKRRKITRDFYVSLSSCYLFFVMTVLFTLLTIFLDPASFFSVREEQYDTGNQGGFLKILVFAGKIMPYFAIIHILQNAIRSKSRSQYYVLLSLVVPFALLVSNPINTSRYISMTSLTMLVIYVISMLGKMRWVKIFVLVSPILYLALLPVTSLVRHGLESVDATSIALSYTSLEFSSFQVLIDAFLIKGQLASSIYTVSALLIFIPRSIWASKSEGLGDEIANLSGYVFTNTGVTTSFNMFADYGWIGLVVFSFVVGFVMKKSYLHNWMSLHNRSAYYSVLFFVMIPMLVRGDLSTYMIAIYSFVFTYELSHFLLALSFKSVLMPSRARQ